MDWNRIVNEYQVHSNKELLTELYINKGLTIQEICNTIHVSTSELQKEMTRNEIPIKKPGGRGKKPGEFICRHCGQKFQGDIRNVCCQNPECREKEDKIIRQAKYDNNNRRRSRKTKNPCQVCGRDKGVNRWFCKECLSAISAGALYD